MTLSKHLKEQKHPPKITDHKLLACFTTQGHSQKKKAVANKNAPLASVTGSVV